MADNFDSANSLEERLRKRVEDKQTKNIENIENNDKDPLTLRLKQRIGQQELLPALRPAGQSIPSIADVAIPAFFHGASIGAYSPENYKKLVEARPWTAGISDFVGSAIPITLLSMLAGPVVGLGARGMLGVNAATKTANIATAAVTGATVGAGYGGTEAIFEGKPIEEVAKQAVKTGAIFGALEPIAVGAGMAYKAYKGLKFDKKLATAMGKQVEDIRGDLISQFKDAVQNGDEVSMSKIKKEFDKYPNINAGGIKSGTIIELPPPIGNNALVRQEPKIIKEENLFSFKDKPALGEFRPIKLDTTKVEIKNNVEEGAKEFTKRRSEIFDVLLDVDNKKLLDATTDITKKTPSRHVKFRVTNGEVSIVEINGVKQKDANIIQDGLNELKNNYFNSDIYGTVYKNLMEENLSLDTNGAIKSLKEQSIGELISGKKLVTIKELNASAKSKGLIYEQRLNNSGAFEFNLKAENGDEIFFPTISSTNEFLSNYKKGMSIVDRDKLIEGSYQYVIDNAPELVANLPKVLDENLLKQEAEKLDIKFNGIQRGINGEEIPLFTDLKSKSTFSKREKETLSEALERKRKEFGIVDEKLGVGEKTEVGRNYEKILSTEKMTAKEIIDNITMKEGEALPDFSGLVGEQITKEGYNTEKDIGIWAYIKPMKHALLLAEEKTKIPVYSKIYLPLEQAMKQHGNWLHPQHREVEKIWKGIKKSRREEIGKTLETTGLIRYDKNYLQTMKQIQANPELKYRFGNLTEQEFNTLISTRKKLDEYFSLFNVDPQIYLEDYLPRIKQMKQSFSKQTIADLKMPKEYNVFFRHQREGNLWPREQDPLRMLKSYSSIGATEKFIMPAYKDAAKLYDSLGGDKELPDVVGKITRIYMDNVRGWKTGTGYAIDQTSRNVINFINNLAKKTGWSGLSPEEVENLARNWISYELSLTYSGAMGFRAYTTIRNAFQPVITTLPLVGSKWFLLGLKDALTKEGWRAARSAGHLIEDMAPVAFGEEMVGKALGEFASMSLYGVRKSDSLGRVIAYNAALRKATHYGDLLIKDIRGMLKRGTSPSEILKRKKKFINQTEMDWLTDVVKNKELDPLINAGRMKEVAELYAKHVVEDTQFIYRKANGPVWARGNLGKLVGQFGTWPTWYVQLVRSMMRGNKVNVTKRLTRVAAIGGLTTTVGSNVFGVDIHKWVWHYPLLWGGPPSAGVLSAAMDAMNGSEYDKAKAFQTIQNFGEIHIPGFMAIKDLYKAGQEEDFEPMIKRGLGFKPMEEE